jgi:hypothetical protein
VFLQEKMESSEQTPSLVWPVDVVVSVFYFLYPRDQWNLRRVSRRWRLAVDHLQHVFYPFAVLQHDHPTIIGTFCFSTQEVLFVTTVQPLQVMVSQGKGRLMTLPNLPSIGEDIADALRHVVPNFVSSSESVTATETPTAASSTTTSSSQHQHGRYSRVEHEQLDDPSRSHMMIVSATSTFFFLFSDTTIPERDISALKVALSRNSPPSNSQQQQLRVIAARLPSPDDNYGMIRREADQQSEAVGSANSMEQQQQHQQQWEAMADPKRNTTYKPGTVWFDVDHGFFSKVVETFSTSGALHFAISAKNPAPLQWWIHHRIMTTVSVTSSTHRAPRRVFEDSAPSEAVRDVEHYNAYYGIGAVLFSHSDALAAFGQPDGSALGFKDPVVRQATSARVNDDDLTTATTAAGTFVSWQGLPSYSGLRQITFSASDGSVVVEDTTAQVVRVLVSSVILVMNEVGRSVNNPSYPRGGGVGGRQSSLQLASQTFLRRYPNAKLHLGEAPSGEEAVIEARTIGAMLPSYQYAMSSSSVRLYIADNTFFAEAYDEEFLLPTDFLKKIWFEGVKRDVDAESNAPNIHGRPLTAPWILWGAEGTYSTPHCEPSASCVWVHVFEGSKRWCVYNDSTQQWESFVQPEGSTVFMGRGIWHAVINTSTPTFAIACNYIPMCDM